MEEEEEVERRRRRWRGGGGKGGGGGPVETKESSTMPLQRFIPTGGIASLEGNRFKTLKHVNALFSGFQRHGST
eukprot:3770916-Pyramimonas_sp.AAC.1